MAAGNLLPAASTVISAAPDTKSDGVNCLCVPKRVPGDLSPNALELGLPLLPPEFYDDPDSIFNTYSRSPYLQALEVDKGVYVTRMCFDRHVLMPACFMDCIRDCICNSRKYSQPSTIRVAVFNSQNHLFIIINDCGDGLREDILQRYFFRENVWVASAQCAAAADSADAVEVVNTPAAHGAHDAHDTHDARGYHVSPGMPALEPDADPAPDLIRAGNGQFEIQFGGERDGGALTADGTPYSHLSQVSHQSQPPSDLFGAKNLPVVYRRPDKSVVELGQTAGVSAGRQSRFHSRPVHRHFGMGFGIAKAIFLTKAYGGVFSVSSCLGGGTRIVMKVPLPRENVYEQAGQREAS